jgi:hypothetical protein
VRLIVATRSSGPPASGKIINEMPVSVASGTPISVFFVGNNVIILDYLFLTNYSLL